MERFPMFCNQFENEGMLYLYDELDADHKKRFEAHLLNCSKCNLAVKQINETRSIYRHLESEVPSNWIQFSLKFKLKIVQYSNEFKRFLSKMFKPGKVWIPATASAIAFILICLSVLGIFKNKSNPTLNPQEILEWTILNDASINSLDEHIDEIFAGNFKTNVAKIENQLEDSIFNDDLGLNEIQQDIIFLSWEINQSYF